MLTHRHHPVLGPPALQPPPGPLPPRPRCALDQQLVPGALPLHRRGTNCFVHTYMCEGGCVEGWNQRTQTAHPLLLTLSTTNRPTTSTQTGEDPRVVPEAPQVLGLQPAQVPPAQGTFPVSVCVSVCLHVRLTKDHTKYYNQSVNQSVIVPTCTALNLKDMSSPS